MSRVDSARIAAWKAGEAGEAAGLPESPATGSVVASDAFFPFADGLEAAVAAGATAVIQPGGSVRDAEVIAAADKPGSPWSSPACGISGISTPLSRVRPSGARRPMARATTGRKSLDGSTRRAYFCCTALPACLLSHQT